MIPALAIFIPTLALIILKPKPLNEATAAALGAFVMLVTGVVTPEQAFSVLVSTANILLFFLGLMLTTTVAERGGFFEWSAIRAVGLAGGSGRRLLLVIFGLGAVVTIFFSNDATALVLTPLVYVLVTRLRLNPLPYVFVCAFIANTASIVLPISNPVNLLPVERFGLTITEYLHFLLLPAAAAILINVGLFAAIFRKDIPDYFDSKLIKPFRTDPFFRFVCAGLIFTAAGYIIALAYRLPLSWPALAGALFLLAGGLAFRRFNLADARKGVSWSILLFILSLAVLVRGLDNTGFTRTLGEAVVSISNRGVFAGIVATTFLTALGANLINNWSMMMVSVSSLGSISNPAPGFSRGIIYSTILGADLGPNIAILGSLSTMLWLILLRQRGLDIRPTQYLKLGLIVTPPMLISGALGIYAATAGH